MLIDLETLKAILYRENAVIDENDVEPLMAVIEKEVMAENFKKLLLQMSRYNAAEGQTWTKETKARQECRQALRMQGLQLLQMGIDPDEIKKQGSYLVDEWR